MIILQNRTRFFNYSTTVKLIGVAASSKLLVSLKNPEFSGAESLKKVVKLFWTFKVPWKWAYNGSVFPDWVAQFGFGFYSLMLTFTLIGLIVMAMYKERTWCSFCPMGTMTQGICKIKAKKGSENL